MEFLNHLEAHNLVGLRPLGLLLDCNARCKWRAPVLVLLAWPTLQPLASQART